MLVVGNRNMCMEHWLDDNDMGKPKQSQNLSILHFVHHNSHMDCPAIELWHLWWEAWLCFRNNHPDDQNLLGCPLLLTLLPTIMVSLCYWCI